MRLLRADPGHGALLLERLHHEDLRDLWDLEACEVVADLAALPRSAPLPRRLVEQAVSLSRDLVSDPASTGTTLHTDPHYENVLAGDREPWLAIDPKPVSGDPHYEPAPMLWNRLDELTGDPGQSLRTGLRQRFHRLVDVAGLDEPRARDWGRRTDDAQRAPADAGRLRHRAADRDRRLPHRLYCDREGRARTERVCR